MPDVKSTIATQEGTNPTVPTTGTQTSSSVTTGTVNQATVSTVGVAGESGTAVNLEQAQNVDTTTDGLANGSILIYKTATNKWQTTKLMNEGQQLDSGEF
jgi:hypothetical protein|tara:strand:- start:10153 stop:10452 length:300 start_codon:yes stop_codon:yes gene_type:complete